MTTPPPPAFDLTHSRGFINWLAGSGGSLAFTTYQAGKVFFLGIKPDGRLSVFERSFPRCMGLGVSDDGRTMLLATQAQLYRFDNILPEGARQDGYDAVYAPKQTWITGDIDIHDVDIGADGPVFVNTLFNCLGTVSDGHSFRPIWKPAFIDRLAAEDRCHLNGMAVADGQPRYVTAVSRSNVVDGWRDRRDSSGIVMDVTTGQIVADGLSMPHSPRLHEGKLWILNSGKGEFGWIDPATGVFTAIAFCPGYARGLTLLGGYAVIGLSLPRDNKTFQDLPLDAALATRDAAPRCGLLVIDLTTGDTVEWVRIDGIITELFDVAYLPRTTCPSAIGLKGSDILRTINIDES